MIIFKKFEKSILFLIKLFVYAACFATFFLLFSIDNREIIDLSRTAAVTLSTYAIILLLLTGIYGRFDVGMRKMRPIVFSLSLAHLITDLITYLELSIMKTNEANNTTFKLENLGILLAVIVLQFIWIILFTMLGNAFYFRINGAEKCLIVTSEAEDAKRVAAALKDFSRRYELLGIVSYDSADLEEKMLAADTIVLYEVPVDIRTGIVNFSYQNLKNVYFNPHIADILEQNSKSVTVDDISFFASQFHTITFEQRIVKRLMDISISLIGLILTSPLLLFAAIAIKKYDGGKVLFKQKRATVHGKVFEIYKFRTMRENAGNYSVKDHDERVTKPGRFLRKYRIDELPQLFNILKGDMSLVGPRPEMLENVEDYTRELPEFRYRLRMKAGLTGYAQIIGKYNTSSRDKLMLDLMYIENFSILRDVQLLFQTILVLFKAEDSTEAFHDED
ncbi:MAG: exopolysaccharide biosynthesis polyprenyl glycosylphosphotransferase [Lachnospiraceae bacterium]|nr:exopolysaccharide biosynthesis polyprenyl glycosylphosphotransferase [Lachnospiraceae bacterium]